MSSLKREIEAEIARRASSAGPSGIGGGAGALSRGIRPDTAAMSGRQSPPAKKEFISLREFARRVGISHKAVQKAVKAGRLTTCDNGGRWPVLDFEEAYAAWKSTRIVQNNNRYGELASDWDGPDDWEVAGAYTIARTKLAEEQAAKIRLEREEMEGHLLRAEDVIKVCGNTIIAFRSRMLAVPGKLSRLIAGLTGYGDLVALESVIQPVIYEALEDLSRLYDCTPNASKPDSSSEAL